MTIQRPYADCMGCPHNRSAPLFLVTECHDASINADACQTGGSLEISEHGIALDCSAISLLEQTPQHLFIHEQ